MIDHRIAMMGRSPNILGEMARGTQLAGMANEVNRTNQLQNLFQQQGAGIMAGDPTAMNALASFDPVMATNIQTTQAENRRADTRLGMAQEELQMLRERTARAIAEAEDRQQAEAEARSAIQMAIQAEAALTAGDTATWSQITREFTGGQPLEPTPDNMRRILAIAQGGQEALAGLQQMYAAPAAPDFGDIDAFRREFAGQAPVKAFSTQAQAFGRIVASAQDPSPAGDMALIFNFMKVLDPGSTVREGEFATAQNATGVPGQIINLYNQVLQGTRLNEQQRADFVGRAERLYNNAEQEYMTLRRQFEDIAQQRRYPVDQALLDYRYTGERMPPPAAPEVVPPPAPTATPSPAPAQTTNQGSRGRTERRGVTVIPAVPEGVDPNKWPAIWENMAPEDRKLFQ